MVKRAVSSVLFACGIVMVFMGLSTALGFTPAGMIASVAVIAALLYAGGAWFAGVPAQLAMDGADSVIVFDRSLRVVGGPATGVSLLSRFPEQLRPELEMRCRMALRGEHTQFSCEHAGKQLAFDISPVQTVVGIVLYGVVITGAGVPAPAVASAPLTTVA